MNNLSLTLPQTVLSMTSLDIAGLLKKRHDNVRRTVETLVNQGIIPHPQIEEVKIQRERREETVAAYRFTGESGKRDSLVVVARLSPAFTARLVDRWQELEEAARKYFTIPESYTGALRLAADMAERAMLLENKVAEQTPKVQGFDRIANADGMFTVREAAKNLDVPERKLVDWLLSCKWIFRRPNGNGLMAYADKAKQGYLTHKTVAYQNPRTGTDVLREAVRITGKGMADLASAVPLIRMAA